MFSLKNHLKSGAPFEVNIILVYKVQNAMCFANLLVISFLATVNGSYYKFSSFIPINLGLDNIKP